MKQLQLLLFVLLVACSNRSNTEELTLYNDITFDLHKGEKLKEINITLKELYLGYFKKASFQVPLFKIIESEDYILFIGIPYNTSIKELANYKIKILKPNNEQIKAESDSVSYFYKGHKTNDSVIIEFGHKFDENIIYVLAIVYSNEKINLFTKTELLKRFNKKR